MVDEKLKNNAGNNPEQDRKGKSSPLSADRKLFGASAFFETKDDGDDVEILSLDSLREAFAAIDVEAIADAPNMADALSDTTEPPEIDGESPSETDEPDAEEPLTEADSMEMSPKLILEAMLFVGNRENRPLTPEFAAERMRNVQPDEIDAAVVALNQNYLQLGCPYYIVQEEDGYRMVLRPEFNVILERFYGKIRESTLSQQAIDTLAVVAYRQPISADDIQRLRKEPCAAVLTQLVRRGLIGVERELRDKKKVTVYRTTDRFLELFHLESLDDLPIAEEIDFR